MKLLYYITGSYLQSSASYLIEQEVCCNDEITNPLISTDIDELGVYIPPGSPIDFTSTISYLDLPVYTITDLIVCSSLGQVIAVSSSVTIVSYPINQTQIVDYANYISSSGITFLTASTTSSFSTPGGTWPAISGSELLVGIGWKVKTTGSYLLEVPSLYQITDNSFKIVQLTTGSFPYSAPPPYITGSILELSNFYSVEGVSTAPSGALLKLELTGSGTYYKNELRVSTPNSGGYYINVSASNQPISVNFYPSDTPLLNSTAQPGLPLYNIEAITTPIGAIIIEFADTASSPVQPLDSLAGWNTYFNISASDAYVTASRLELSGDSLGYPTYTPQLYSSSVTRFESYTVGTSFLYRLEYNSQSSFPVIKSSGSVTELYLNNNQISGTLAPIEKYDSIRTMDLSNNQLSGSTLIPSLTATYINYSNNYFTGYTSGSVSSLLTYFNAENNLLSQSAIEEIVKDVYETEALNGYLNLSGSGNATASLVAFQTASLLEIDRGWEVYLNGYTFDADFLVATYQFDGVTGGTDLDIRTRVVSPVGTKYHGYGCQDNTPSFNAALTVPPTIPQTSYTSTAPYLYWSGDNTLTGSESIYVDLSSSFLPSDTIQVECRAYWFGTPTLGSMSLDITAYKGGYMSQSGYQFQNVGGTQVATITIPKVITLQTASAATLGELVGNVYYNRTTNTIAIT